LIQGSGENSQQLELDEAMNRSIDHTHGGTKPKVTNPKEEGKTKPLKDQSPEHTTKGKPKETAEVPTKQKHLPQKPGKNSPDKSESTDQPKNTNQTNASVKIKDPHLPSKPTIADPFQPKTQPFSSEKQGGFPQFQPGFGVPPGYLQSQQPSPGFEPLKNHQTPQMQPHPSSTLAQQSAALSKADKEKIEAAKALAEDLSSKLGSVPAEISDMKSKTS
jgi:hypothetical protein